MHRPARGNGHLRCGFQLNARASQLHRIAQRAKRASSTGGFAFSHESEVRGTEPNGRGRPRLRRARGHRVSAGGYKGLG
eukprot:6884647-Pyramimonas_sp.AAC.1